MTSTINYSAGDCDTRPWGRWEVLAVGEGYIIKVIDVNAGEILSLQSHEHRNEHWTIIAGAAQVTLDEDKIDMNVDDTVFIPIGTRHRIHNTGDQNLRFIEIQTGAILDENDVIRYEDRYGRTGAK